MKRKRDEYLHRLADIRWLVAGPSSGQISDFPVAPTFERFPRDGILAFRVTCVRFSGIVDETYVLILAWKKYTGLCASFPLNGEEMASCLFPQALTPPKSCTIMI